MARPALDGADGLSSFFATAAAPTPQNDGRLALCTRLGDETREDCRKRRFRDDLSDDEMLRECHHRLQTIGAVTRAEADWIIERVARTIEPVAG